MTPVERRLATGVVASWMILSICTSALRIAWRISSHKPVYPFGALMIEQEWLVQGLAAAVLAVYTWRNRNQRFRFLWFIAVAFVLFLGSETVNVLLYIPAKRFLPSASLPLMPAVVNMFIVDVTHFFILALGAIAVPLMIHAYRDSLAAEREEASIEARLAETRVHNLRTQLRPALIRSSLQTIEAMLPADPEGAEAALLNLSDFLRLTLLRARRPQLPHSIEAEYVRRAGDVTGTVAS